MEKKNKIFCYVCLLNFALLQDTTALQVSIFKPLTYSLRITMANHHDTHMLEKKTRYSR